MTDSVMRLQPGQVWRRKQYEAIQIRCQEAILIFVLDNVDDCDVVEGQSLGKNGFPTSVVSRRTVGDWWWWAPTEKGQNLERYLVPMYLSDQTTLLPPPARLLLGASTHKGHITS